VASSDDGPGRRATRRRGQGDSLAALVPAGGGEARRATGGTVSGGAAGSTRVRYGGAHDLGVRATVDSCHDLERKAVASARPTPPNSALSQV